MCGAERYAIGCGGASHFITARCGAFAAPALTCWGCQRGAHLVWRGLCLERAGQQAIGVAEVAGADSGAEALADAIWPHIHPIDGWVEQCDAPDRSTGLELRLATLSWACRARHTEQRIQCLRIGPRQADHRAVCHTASQGIA